MKRGASGGEMPILDHLEELRRVLIDSLIAIGVGMGLSWAFSGQLLDLLNKHGVAPIEAIGVPFDPAYHDAAARIATTEAPEGTVVTELQKGYLMGHRVLRPSRVGVAGPR